VLTQYIILSRIKIRAAREGKRNIWNKKTSAELMVVDRAVATGVALRSFVTNTEKIECRQFLTAETNLGIESLTARRVAGFITISS